MTYDRAQFNYDDCARRIHQSTTLDLLKAAPGELDYLQQIADLWIASSHTAIRATGMTLAAAVDAERARLEWAWNAEAAMFDSLMATTLTEPEPDDISELPKWSELPPEPFPGVSQPD